MAANCSEAPIDVAFVGVGENGHLAFNDPPADFDTQQPYAVVTLDEPCRRQQLNEGWFATLEDVPRQAISMTISQILKAKEILCIVPDARKAQAVKNCFDAKVSPDGSRFRAAESCQHYGLSGRRLQFDAQSRDCCRTKLTNARNPTSR